MSTALEEIGTEQVVNELTHKMPTVVDIDGTEREMTKNEMRKANIAIPFDYKTAPIEYIKMGGRSIMVKAGVCVICEKPSSKACGRLNHDRAKMDTTTSDAPCRGCGGPIGIVSDGQEKFYCRKDCRKALRHSKKAALQAA